LDKNNKNEIVSKDSQLDLVNEVPLIENIESEIENDLN
jgi:hypothetical protein